MSSIDADARDDPTMLQDHHPVLTPDIKNTATADAILRLDRKIARAIQTEKGINLKPDELDLLTLVGAVNLLGKARSEILKEKAQCRHRMISIVAASSNSTGSLARTANLSVPTSTSAGMTRSPGGCSDAARARLIFG